MDNHTDDDSLVYQSIMDHAANHLDDRTLDTDYYALLNIHHTASPSDIKDAYKSLCKTFHPDKHHHDLRTSAQKQFIRIQHAYWILSDPVKRTLYDLYGSSCPELNDSHSTSSSSFSTTAVPGPEDDLLVNDHDLLQVGHVLKTPDQIRKEYEDRIRAENLLKLDHLVRQRGDISIQLDACPLLFPNAYNPPVPRQIVMKSLQVKYATHTPISDTFTVGLSGRMMTQGQRGLGSVRANFKKAFTNLTNGELIINLISPHSITAKLRHVIHEPSDTAIESDIHWSNPTFPPTGSLTLTRRLVKNMPVFGFLRLYSGQYAIGSWGAGTLATQIKSAASHQTPAAKPLTLSKDAVSSLQVGVQYNHDVSTMTTWTFQTSLFEQTLVLRHLRKLNTANGPGPSLDLTVHGDAMHGGVGVAWKLAHQVGEHLRLAIGTSANSALGTLVTLEIGYLGQKLIVPVSIIPGFNILGFVVVSSVPLVSATLAWFAVFEPYRKHMFRQKLKQAQDNAVYLFTTRRADALSAQSALKSTVGQKYVRESRSDAGLVIVQALYGKIRSVVNTRSRGRIIKIRPDEQACIIDVTVPVFALCTNATLYIQPDRSKVGLIGFYDPCPWEDKQLLVTYLFRNVYRQVLVNDFDALAIPRRSHLIIDDPTQVPFSDVIAEIRGGSQVA